MQILREESGVSIHVPLRLQRGVTSDVAGGAGFSGNDDRSGSDCVESVLIALAPVEGAVWRERQLLNRIQSERRLYINQVAFSEELRVAEVGACFVQGIECAKSLAFWIPVAAERVHLETQPRLPWNRVKPVAGLRRNRPRTDITRAEPAELIDKLIVVVPVWSGSPETSSNCFSLFAARTLHILVELVVLPHVVEIDVSARQDRKSMHTVDSPETRLVIERIIEETLIRLALPQSEPIYFPMRHFCRQPKSVKAPSYVAPVARGDKIRRSERHFLTAYTQGH